MRPGTGERGGLGGSSRRGAQSGPIYDAMKQVHDHDLDALLLSDRFGERPEIPGDAAHLLLHGSWNDLQPLLDGSG